jgi:hypothetical protein
MFRLFFSHLGTTIPAIEVYLCERPNHRDLIPIEAKGLLEFKTLAETAEKSIIQPVQPKKKKKASKKKVDVEQVDDDDDVQETGSAGDLVLKLGWNFDKYALQWRKVYNLMSLHALSRSNRVAKNRGERILVMSGLTWNSNSRNKPRDFGHIASAIALESAFIEFYREDLLVSCSGARVFRKEAHQFFLSVALTHHKQRDLGSPPEMVTEWEFADGIPPDLVSSDATEHYDPVALRKELDTAHATFTRTSRDPVRAFVIAIEKNKLLLAADPNAKKGSIESIAHHCISTLADVSLTRPRPMAMSLTGPSLQVMRFNLARVEYEAENDGKPFMPTNLINPPLPRKPHVTSYEYRHLVSVHLSLYFLLL